MISSFSYIEKLLKSGQKFFFVAHWKQSSELNFLQTLRAYFEKEERLRTSPVIYLNFSKAGDYLNFFGNLSRQITEVGLSYDVRIFDSELDFSHQFTRLISAVSKRKPNSVILLVDEYDWPVRQQIAINDVVEAQIVEDFLKSFFAVLKAKTKELKFVCVTGATTVTAAQFRNGANTFVDLTNDQEFEALAGPIEGREVKKNNSTFEEIVEAVRKMYRDYRVLRTTDFDEEIENHWHESETPQYIFDHFRDRYLPANAFCKLRVSRDRLLTKHNLNEEFPIEIYMILNGYLTYCDYDKKTDEFVVDYPDEKTKLAFIRAMWKPRVSDSRVPIAVVPSEVKQSMIDGDIRGFVQCINNLSVSSLRYPEESRLVKLIASFLNVSEVACEVGRVFRRKDSSVAGDIDLQTIDLPVNYAIELKWLKSAEIAFQKLLKYSNVISFQRAHEGKTIYLVGVNFGFVQSTIMVNEWIRVKYLDGKCSELEASNADYLRKFAHITRPNFLCNTLYHYESS